ncbi:LysM domain-containing protein [Plectosphaerella plurivora]|uniref:LysM domain-containing protein n=1 Tax=Plectosphaerella plurivora TaxID=936078 RepID=A0A9P8V5Y6_9PEZI|nr:LysM domain-containing protein [Plectosphaerella plurivora]
MRSSLRLGVALVALVRLGAAQFTVEPPTTAPSDTIQDCTNWHVAAAGDTCADLAEQNFITEAQLLRYNPSLANGCNFVEGTSYCTEQNWGIPPPPETTSTTAAAATTTSTGIVTPLPTQPPSIVPGCTRFHFVQTGTDCTTILNQYGITIAQLYAWNSGVGPTCSGLWAEVYVCVAGPAVGSPTTTQASTTSANPTSTGANGIVTPSPTQPPSIVSNCNKFDFVDPGTSCTNILSRNGLTIAQLFAWNSGVNADCSGMWANVYLCVGVIGGSPTTITTSTTRATTTSAGNGITTPTPTQPPSIVSNCNKFYFVEPGTSCTQVLSANGITLAQLFAWNSGVNSDCSGMWASVHLCVGIIGGSTPTTTTRATTTSAGNGVATPTPTMPNMVTNCNRFYKVVENDTCDVIRGKTGVSNANLISWNGLGASCNVWLGYYLCTRLI